MTTETRPTFTPGPWQYGWGGHMWIVADSDTERVAAVGVPNAIPERFEEANARLIAAAPELYEALLRLIASDLTPPTPPDYATRGAASFSPWESRLISAQNAARAALAKADGR